MFNIITKNNYVRFYKAHDFVLIPFVLSIIDFPLSTPDWAASFAASVSIPAFSKIITIISLSRDLIFHQC